MTDDLIPPRLRDGLAAHRDTPIPSSTGCVVCDRREPIEDLNPIHLELREVCADHIDAYWMERARTTLNPIFPKKQRDARRLHPSIPADLDYTTGRGVCLWGPFGSGKTYNAVALTKRVWLAGARAGRPPRVVWRNTAAFVDELKDAMDGRGGSVTEVMGRVLNADVLVLDDLGRERPTPYVRERLYRIVNERYEEERMTIVTTNHNPNGQLGPALSGDDGSGGGEAIASRMFETMTFVHLPDVVPLRGGSGRS